MRKELLSFLRRMLNDFFLINYINALGKIKMYHNNINFTLNSDIKKFNNGKINQYAPQILLAPH